MLPVVSAVLLSCLNTLNSSRGSGRMTKGELSRCCRSDGKGRRRNARRKRTKHSNDLLPGPSASPVGIYE